MYSHLSDFKLSLPYTQDKKVWGLTKGKEEEIVISNIKHVKGMIYIVNVQKTLLTQLAYFKIFVKDNF